MNNATVSFIEVIEPKIISRVIVSIPHGGIIIPLEFTSNMKVPTNKLWSDWYTQEIYDFLPSLDIAIIRTNLSRFVADANRDPNKPVFAPFWEGIVASTDTSMNEIYTDRPSAAELNKRIAIAHTSYHTKLKQLVNRSLEYYPSVLLLDLHSFGMPIIADVVIGDSYGKSASRRSVELVEKSINGVGLNSQRNEPFSGGWIIRQFNEYERVDAIQIELNQRRYALEEDVSGAVSNPRKDNGLFSETQHLLKTALQSICNNYSK